jgi:hypothetical protein
MRLAYACLALCASALAAASCSSSKGTATADDGGEACTPASVSFQNEVMPIFAASCSTGAVCHGQVGNSGEEKLYLGLNPTEGMNTSAIIATVYAGLVGIKSEEDPSMALVTSGSLLDSYLWHKVIGDQNTNSTVAAACLPAATGPNPCIDCLPSAPCGAQMPFAAATLTPAAVCVIQNWISEGAPGN